MASKSLPARVGCMSLSTFATTANAASTPDKARRAVPASALIAMIVPIPIATGMRNRQSPTFAARVLSAYEKAFLVI